MWPSVSLGSCLWPQAKRWHLPRSLTSSAWSCTSPNSMSSSGAPHWDPWVSMETDLAASIISAPQPKSDWCCLLCSYQTPSIWLRHQTGVTSPKRCSDLSILFSHLRLYKGQGEGIIFRVLIQWYPQVTTSTPGPGSQFQHCFYFSTDSWRKNYGENADFGLGKTFIQNNYLNLTLPRKRTPRVSFRLVFYFRKENIMPKSVYVDKLIRYQNSKDRHTA